jgi:tetratricopeptide (TPR) repeat protein
MANENADVMQPGCGVKDVVVERFTLRKLLREFVQTRLMAQFVRRIGLGTDVIGNSLPVVGFWHGPIKKLNRLHKLHTGRRQSIKALRREDKEKTQGTRFVFLDRDGRSPQARTADHMSGNSVWKISLGILRLGFCGILLALFGSPNAIAEGTNSPVQSGETNSLELQTYLQLQEQLHATRLAIESVGIEAKQAAAQNAEQLAARLHALEQAVAAQRAKELEAMQSSNRNMLYVAGAFASIGCVAMLLMGYFQWRTVNRLAELSAGFPAGAIALGGLRPIAALGPGGTHEVTAAPITNPNPELLETIHRLEKRVHELEHSSPPPLANGDPAGDPHHSNGHDSNGSSAPVPAEKNVHLLLGKGQSLLNIDKAEEAMACFDEVLALEPNNADALVKKGTALERLRKLNEAIECYDHAIAADSSMTIAYLYKGGLFNRMERFTEALECYEMALRTQEERREAV